MCGLPGVDPELSPITALPFRGCARARALLRIWLVFPWRCLTDVKELPLLEGMLTFAERFELEHVTHVIKSE